MPTAMKNRPEQQPLEGLEVRLQLVPELAVGEQHAGEEGAERHRQAGELRQQRGGDHRQQCRGGEHLGDLDARHDAQRRAQQRSGRRR